MLKKKFLLHSNKLLVLAIFGLIGSLTGCMPKYGCPPDEYPKEDTTVQVVPLYGVPNPAGNFDDEE